jgi:hypothetical protein
MKEALIGNKIFTRGDISAVKGEEKEEEQDF